MSTKTSVPLKNLRPWKIGGAILSFLILAWLSEAFFFFVFFLTVFVLIFRAMIKQKEKTGHWPIKSVPGCPRSRFNNSWSPSPRIGSREWNMNPLNPGSAAWHASQPIRR